MARQFVFSLRARMITLILLISLPTIGLIIHNDLQHRNRLAREAKEDALHLTRLVAKEYNRRQTEARMLSSLMLEIPRLRNAEPESCKEVFSRMLDQYDQFTSLNICSTEGKILCSVPRAPAGTNFADRPYFRQALESGRFASSGFITGRVTGKSLVAFALPALDEEDRVERVIVGGLNTSWLNEMLEEPFLPEGSIFKIIDSEGSIRLRIPDPGQWTGRSAPDWPLLDKLKAAGREGVVEAPDLHDHRQRVHAFTVLDETQGPDIYFSTGIPSEIVFAEAERSLRRNVLIVALLAAFIFLAAWIGADLFLVRQVRALRETTDRLKKGDLAARANLPGWRSEIGDLGESFDGMAAGLQKSAEEAEEHQARITRLNRVYSVLSGINGAIIRLREQKELLEEVCKIAVYKGGLQMASVGLLDPDKEKIRIMSREGSGESFMEHQDIPVAETSIANRNTISEALKKLEPFISNDIDADQRLGGWRKKALECGFRSFGAFPLVIGNELVGTLNLYTDTRHFFDDQEIGLLTELAADTALGLENIEKESHINYLAYYDTLTGMPNLALFNDRLEQALKRASAMNRLVAVAVFKILRFREVNQLLGYRAGDQLLRDTANYLSDTVRQGDTVARTGASEFAIVLSDVAEEDDIPVVAEKLLRNFENLPILREEDFFVTARLGLSVFPGDGKGPGDSFQKRSGGSAHAASQKRQFIPVLLGKPSDPGPCAPQDGKGVASRHRTSGTAYPLPARPRYRHRFHLRRRSVVALGK